MGVASVVSAGVGLLATASLPYYGAVLGMVAGAPVFALASGLAAARTLRRAGYWTYAAW